MFGKGFLVKMYDCIKAHEWFFFFLKKKKKLIQIVNWNSI